MEKKTEEQLWKENKKELSALIADLNIKLLEGQVFNPKIGFILNWSTGTGAYSLRLSKKRQIKEKKAHVPQAQASLNEEDGHDIPRQTKK